MPRELPKLLILNRIYELRVTSGLTQEEFARGVGITRATVVALEKGIYNPSLLLAFRLANYFKTDIQEIFYLERLK